tara:strand:+ start:3193 stop:3453 length:261 start_codon:yes stop_codon:yes gene_type:complete
MALIGIFILGTIIGIFIGNWKFRSFREHYTLKSKYLKEHIKKLEENAEQKKRKNAYRASRRNAKKGGTGGQSKGSGRKKSGGSKSS